MAKRPAAKSPAAKAPATSAVASASERKNLQRLLESKDKGARAQGLSLLRSYGDPALYELLLGGLTEHGHAWMSRNTRYDNNDRPPALERRPWRVGYFANDPVWPPDAPRLLQKSASGQSYVSSDALRMALEAPPGCPTADALRAERRALALVTDYGFHGDDVPLAELARLEALEVLQLHAQSAWTLRAKDLAHLARLPRLRSLMLSNVTLPDGLAGLEGCARLDTLELHLPSLTSLASLPALPSLRALLLRDARALRDLGEPGALRGLRVLYAHDVPALEGLAGLEGAAALERFYLHWARSLRSLAGLEGARALTRFELYGATALASLEGLPPGPSLARFELSDALVTSLAPLRGHASTLELVGLQDCAALERFDLGPAVAMPALRHLDVEGCAALRALPSLAGAPGLRTLWAKGCGKLDDVSALGAVDRAALHRVDLRESALAGPQPALGALHGARVLALGGTAVPVASLPPRVRVAASFLPAPLLDRLDARTPAQLAWLAAAPPTGSSASSAPPSR